jgi:hypothetical protein
VKKKKMNKIKTNNKKVLLGLTISILLVMMCVVPFGTQATIADFTEGGHLETDFNVTFMAEWWYLNGDARLVASDGEKRDIGFFVVMSHQESPMLAPLSHLLTSYGIYFDNGTTTFGYNSTYVPRIYLDKYIALHTPYVDYTYISDDMNMDLFFQTNIDKTIDQADEPLNFTTYERSYGTLHGSIFLDGKRYTVTHGKGYMDHMIPITNSGGTWPMDMHGWSWTEVTTKNYQAVAYAVRGLGDGYGNYSYKHLTLLNKHNGKILAEYSGDEITITETGWINETDYNRERPSVVAFSTSDLNVTVNVTVNPETVAYFDQTDPINATGFVDFMAFQPDGAAIQYNGNIEEGRAFYEYLVTDVGVIFSRDTVRVIEKGKDKQIKKLR